MDKAVAVTLLEAAKAVMEQLGAYRMELADRGREDTRHMVAIYGDVRRLKDYLQRCAGAFRETVEMDFIEDDLRLLTACCRRMAHETDMELSVAKDAQRSTLLKQRRDTLIDCAVELASEPLLELPLPKLAGGSAPALRAMQIRLAKRLARRATGIAATEGTTDAGGIKRDNGDGDDDGWSTSQPGEKPGRPRAAARPDPADAGAAALDNSTEPHLDPARALESASSRATATAGPAPRSALLSSMALDLNSEFVGDPRLRSIVALDLRAYDRAIRASDLRSAAVHLTSVLEGVVLDYAIPRVLELGLIGSPESWDVQDVLLRVLGDSCTSDDRAAIYHALAARDLIRPAVQLKSPTVITVVGFRKQLQLAQRVLRRMGFTS